MSANRISVEIPSHLPEPEWGPIGKETYLRTYSRIKPDGNNENWAETIKRTVDGNCNFVSSRYIEFGEPERLFDLLYFMKALPGGRHLWSTGVKDRAYVANCWASGWIPDDFAKHFTFLFARLMEGGGVGSNYSEEYLSSYKPIKHAVDLHIVCDSTHKDYLELLPFISKDFSSRWHGCHTVADSRDGWVEALDLVINAAYGLVRDKYGNLQLREPGPLVLDFSHIRHRGAPLKGFGGTSSGPMSLADSLIAISNLLNASVGKSPDWSLCMSIDHQLARCVVAGNVRRSARMSVKHWKDADIFKFATCKQDGQSHWSTNISVAVDDEFFRSVRRGDEYAKTLLECIARGAIGNGEPGIWNITRSWDGEIDKPYSPNPCGEIILRMWESCNLGSVNLKAFAHRPVEMLEAFRMMTRFLIRATYADYPDPLAQQVIASNRRIGVGAFAFADWMVLRGKRYSSYATDKESRDLMRKAKAAVHDEARRYCFELRIPECIKKTMFAPTGTTGMLPAVSGTGMQTILFKYFIRRMNCSTTSPLQKQLLDEAKSKGYKTEKSLFTPDTEVILYPCKTSLLDNPNINPSLVEEQGELTIDETLEIQKAIQLDYADNAVSFTVNFPSLPWKYEVNLTQEEKQRRIDEALNSPKGSKKIKEVERSIMAFGPDLKGTTLFPDFSNRPQLPYERITKQQYTEMLEAINNNSEKQKGIAAMDRSFDVPEDCVNSVCRTINKPTIDEE